MSLRQTRYSSLHHFTVPDQHKKWVSGVGGREKGGLCGEGGGRKELCQGNGVQRAWPVFYSKESCREMGVGVAVQTQPVKTLSPVFLRKTTQWNDA